jgi:hypothetical protein
MPCPIHSQQQRERETDRERERERERQKIFITHHNSPLKRGEHLTCSSPNALSVLGRDLSVPVIFLSCSSDDEDLSVGDDIVIACGGGACDPRRLHMENLSKREEVN